MVDRAAAVAALVLTLTPIAQAHHSPAMFDQGAPVRMTGEVRLFQWTNPHCYVQLLVKNARGEREEWSLEMAAPMYLYRLGWRPGTLKPGDPIAVTIAPLRSGRHGGLLLEALTSDGRPLASVQSGAAGR